MEHHSPGKHHVHEQHQVQTGIDDPPTQHGAEIWAYSQQSGGDLTSLCLTHQGAEDCDIAPHGAPFEETRQYQAPGRHSIGETTIQVGNNCMPYGPYHQASP